MKKTTILLLLLTSLFSFGQTDESKKKRQQEIIEEFSDNCAKKYSYNLPEWQECLDRGLEKDSTIAYFWQQKAMPLFKARKYEAGMVFIDKAVLYDPENYLDYRAFIKCIFAKTYKDAIVDFENCKKLKGNSYVMDHTYDFHIALSYLQLNEFQKAEEIFKTDIADQITRIGEAHHLDLMYYGMSVYEQKRWEEAIAIFDQSLAQYPNFADVEYYKAICLARLNRQDEANTLFKQAKEDLANGKTINEDQIFYEMYPYQIRKLIKD